MCSNEDAMWVLYLQKVPFLRTVFTSDFKIIIDATLAEGPKRDSAQWLHEEGNSHDSVRINLVEIDLPAYFDENAFKLCKKKKVSEEEWD